MIALQGYRTIIAAVIGAIAQAVGLEMDADAATQGIILAVTLVVTIWMKLKANLRESQLKQEVSTLKGTANE